MNLSLKMFSAKVVSLVKDKLFDFVYLVKDKLTKEYSEATEDDIHGNDLSEEIIPLRVFSWTDDYHRIFLLSLIKGKVGIDDNQHPIFKESWSDFTEDFRNYMIDYNLYIPEIRSLFERPDGNYINGKQILQSHYSDIKKNTASMRQRIQARETHAVMRYMNRYH